MMPQLENVTILVVDDDEVDALGVKRAFRQVKMTNQIIVAEDGRDALHKLRSGSVTKPFMILLDLNMPRMNGFEFLQAVRKDEGLHDAVIFVLTTSNDVKDMRNAYHHNIAGFIVKGGDKDGFHNAASLFEQYARTVDLP